MWKEMIKCELLQYPWLVGGGLKWDSGAHSCSIKVRFKMSFLNQYFEGYRVYAPTVHLSKLYSREIKLAMKL